MDFTVIFQRFAEQSPLVLLCGAVILALFKLYREEKRSMKEERKYFLNELKELHKTYYAEIKELNSFIRSGVNQQ
jgi:hypothetical protein